MTAEDLFTAILTHYADRCRAAYHDEAHTGRVARAVQIIVDGGCERLGADTWRVTAHNGTVENYTVTRGTRTTPGACECKDAQFHHNMCKHRFAIAIQDDTEKALRRARYASCGDAYGLCWWDQRQARIYFLDEATMTVMPVDLPDIVLHGPVLAEVA